VVVGYQDARHELRPAASRKSAWTARGHDIPEAPVSGQTANPSSKSADVDKLIDIRWADTCEPVGAERQQVGRDRTAQALIRQAGGVAP
jgi:hypothetical protein